MLRTMYLIFSIFSRSRNILCFPIKDETNKVIGVAQLCNKIGAEGFSNFDVDIAQAFSVYCCISIQHVRP